MKLTIKQKRFADEYIISGNAEQSAIKAGYSENYARGHAHKLVANVGIKNYLDERLKEINAKKILTIEEAMQITTKIARGEPREIIKYSVDGTPYKELDYPNYNDMNRATEHFYKLKGAFIDKQEVKIENNVILEDILEQLNE